MPKAKGQLEEGTLDPFNREAVLNPDGSYSTMVTTGIEDNGQQIIVPSFWDGQRHSPMEIGPHYRQTGEHFGKFDTIENADAYDKDMHDRIAADAQVKKLTGDPGAMTPQFEDLAQFLRDNYKANK